jgi:hypothetical protein
VSKGVLEELSNCKVLEKNLKAYLGVTQGNIVIISEK